MTRRLSALPDRLRARRDYFSTVAAIDAAKAVDPGCAWADLHWHAVMLDAADLEAQTTPCVNVVLVTARKEGLFAGVRTAIFTAARLASALGVALRVLSLQSIRPEDVLVVEDVVRDAAGRDQYVITVGVHDFAGLEASAADVWLATYWTTALCMQALCRRGRLQPSRVAYLVQDYEPAFYPASTDAATAAATYRAGFHLVVNSAPLAQYLTDVVGVPVSDELVFRPELDWLQLTQAANARTGGDSAVLFYCRPSHPRNMFGLGSAALKLAAQEWRRRTGGPLQVRAAGEDVDALDLGPDAHVELLGRLPWSAYFGELSRAAVLLGLQATPHPSHPPLDMVLAGGRSVTNELGGTRGSLHPRLMAVEADPESLAGAVIDSLAAHEVSPPPAYDAGFTERLGREHSEVVASLADLFRAVLDAR